MIYYAQINEQRVAYAVTQAAAPIDKPDMIPVDSLDESVLGKYHDEATGEFIELP